MMMNDENIQKIYGFAAGMILLAAILFRLLGLGSSALSENEAQLALQALQLADHSASVDGIFSSQIVVTQALYVLPTSLLFRLFRASDWLARLIPALAGIVLSALPLLFRRQLGEKKTLILTLVLSLDPVLIYWSKEADALMPVICLLLYCTAAFINGKPRSGWILLAAACCGGVRFWPFILAAVAALLLLWVFNKAFLHGDFDLFSWFRLCRTPYAGWIFLGSLLLFSTVFLTCPGGLSSLGSGLAASLTFSWDWKNPGLIPLLVSIFFYAGFPLLLFFLRLIRMDRKADSTGFIFMLFVLIFPLLLMLCGQGVLSLPWLTLLLWCFASDVLGELFYCFANVRKPVFLLALSVPLMAFAFVYFRLAELLRIADFSSPLVMNLGGAQTVLPISQSTGYLLILLVCLIIFFLVIHILITYFDNYLINAGLIAGCLLIFTAGTLTNLWSAADFNLIGDHPFACHLSRNVELSGGNQTVLVDNEIIPIIHEIGVKSTGVETDAPGINLLKGESLLDWQLRDEPGLQKRNDAGNSVLKADFIIDQTDADWTQAGFVGMTYDWKQRAQWSSWNLRDWLNWMVYRESLPEAEKLTLWQRSTLILSPQIQTQAQTQIQAQTQ